MAQQAMQAIGFRGYGPPEVLEQLEVARPTVAADTVLIRVAAAGVNPADAGLRGGQLRRVVRLRFPFVPGADVAGIVDAVGSDVTRFRPGDAVYAMLPSVAGGGYAEYAAVAERNVAPAPTNISLAEAAAVPLAALTALQALRDRAALQSGASVLINGASGGVGSFAVQIARVHGAKITAACSARNADFVRDLGANDVIDYRRTDITAGTARYNVVFDAANAHSLWQWRRVLAPGGVAVTVNPAPWNFVLERVAGRFGGPRFAPVFVKPSGSDLAMLTEWIEAGRVRPVIDYRYPLAEAVAAQRYSESRRARGKLVLIVDDALASIRSDSTMSHQAKR